jgi:hypothetical protein
MAVWKNYSFRSERRCGTSAASKLEPTTQTSETTKEKDMSEIEYTVREYEKLPEGTYSAVIESVTENLKRNTKFGEKDALRIRLETEKLGQDGKNLSAILHVNRTIGKGSRLGKVIKQVTGKEMRPGERFDPQSLVGMKVSIVIEHHKNDGRVYADVVHISRCTETAATGNSKRPTANIHGVDITDGDVQFPGGDAASA